MIYSSKPEAAETKTEITEGIVKVILTDMEIACGYASSNAYVEEYDKYLKQMDRLVRNAKKSLLFGGDLNAKFSTWGPKNTDKRGESLEELIAAHQLMTANVGEEPTFIRANGVTSYIDITVHEEALSIQDWEVLTDETMSDHRYITYQVTQAMEGETKETNMKQGWITKGKNPEIFRFNLATASWGRGDVTQETPETLENLIREACDNTYSKRTNRNPTRTETYWWNEDIADKQKSCHKLQRQIMRENKKQMRDEERTGNLKRQYKESKTALRKMMNSARKEAWESLVADVENDPRGEAYQIARKRFRLRSGAEPSVEKQISVTKQLFPECPAVTWTAKNVLVSPKAFTRKELEEAASHMEARKAPGLDNITSEMVKMVVEEIPEIVLAAMNTCLTRQEFLKEWKKASLVLIPKPKKNPGEDTTYRPLCLLNSLNKIFERFIEQRLRVEVEAKNGLSPNQYELRKGKTTIDAVMRVKELA